MVFSYRVGENVSTSTCFHLVLHYAQNAFRYCTPDLYLCEKIVILELDLIDSHYFPTQRWQFLARNVQKALFFCFGDNLLYPGIGDANSCTLWTLRKRVYCVISIPLVFTLITLHAWRQLKER